jgi:hypothetical protein
VFQQWPMANAGYITGIVRQTIDPNLTLRMTHRFSDARISNKMRVFEGYKIFGTPTKSHRPLT